MHIYMFLELKKKDIAVEFDLLLCRHRKKNNNNNEETQQQRGARKMGKDYRKSRRSLGWTLLRWHTYTRAYPSHNSRTTVSPNHHNRKEAKVTRTLLLSRPEDGGSQRPQKANFVLAFIVLGRQSGVPTGKLNLSAVRFLRSGGGERRSTPVLQSTTFLTLLLRPLAVCSPHQPLFFLPCQIVFSCDLAFPGFQKHPTEFT
jgi:hypothetical protein